MNDLPSFRSEPETDRLTLCALISICCTFTAIPAFAQADLAGATTKLTLQVATAILGEKCRRIEAPEPALRNWIRLPGRILCCAGKFYHIFYFFEKHPTG